MTKLNKLVRRETDIPSRLLGRDGAPIIVTLYPDGRIGLKTKGKRTEYCLDLQLLYNQAAIASAEANRKPRKRGRK